MKNYMLPLQNLNNVYDEHMELKSFRYLIGDPLQLRFDGNTGLFRIGDKNILTSTNDSIKMHCLGYRISKDRPFEAYKEPEVWTELYFLTENLAIACLLLRSASATEFNRMVYYWGASPIDTVLELKPIQRFSKEHGKTYWILEPQFTLHTVEEQAICDQLRDNFPNLYRANFLTTQAEILVEHNIYGCPFKMNHPTGSTLKQLPKSDATPLDPLQDTKDFEPADMNLKGMRTSKKAA